MVSGPRSLVVSLLLAAAPGSALAFQTPPVVLDEGYFDCPGYDGRGRMDDYQVWHSRVRTLGELEAEGDESCEIVARNTATCLLVPADQLPRAPATNHRAEWHNVPLPGGQTLFQVAHYFGCTNSTRSFAETYVATGRYRLKDRGVCIACVGNPVSFGSGNKHEAIALYVSPAPGGASLVLHYNSLVAGGSSAFGPAWRHSFSPRIRPVRLLDPMVATAERPDGADLSFTRSGAVWLADSDVRDRLDTVTGPGGEILGWRYLNAADYSVEVYDADGLLQAIEDRYGRTTTLARSDAATPRDIAPGPGFLVAVTDPDGRTLTFTYDVEGAVTSVTDPGGGLSTFTYAPGGDLASITWPDLSVRTFQYNEPANTSGAQLPHALTGITDELGVRFATFRYGVDGRATYSGHAGGAGEVTLTYPSQQPLEDGASQQIGALDPLGARKTYGVTSIVGRSRPTTLTEPCVSCPGGQRTTTSTYDEAGNLTSTTNFNGVVTLYTYDAQGRNLEVRRVEAAGTPVEHTTETTWDPVLAVPSEILEKDRAGRVVRRGVFTWTRAGDVLSMSVVDPSTGAAQTETRTYDPEGRVLTIDGPRTDVSDVTTFTYYAAGAVCPTAEGGHATGCRGMIATVTDALGHVTTYSAYDAHGAPLAVVDPNGVVTRFVYDLRQRLISRTVAGVETRFAYDAAGQQVRVTLGDGAFLDYAYDEAHRLIALQDNLQDRIEYTLDAAGRRLAEDVYGPSGNLVRTARREYDELGRVVAEISANDQVRSYVYDPEGNPVLARDPLGRTWTSTFDALNRLEAQVAPDGARVTRTYDALGQVTSVEGPRGLVTTYEYDAFGHVLASSSPDAGRSRSRYDAAGNLVEVVDALGGTTHLSYDALDRLTHLVDARGEESALTYDRGLNGVGHLTGITDPSGTRELGYDARGRRVRDVRVLATSRASLTLATEYTYDAADRLASMQYPTGRVVRYTRDAAGRVIHVEASLGGTTTVLAEDIAHEPFGGMSSMRVAGGVTLGWDRDLDGNTTGFRTGDAAWTLSRDVAGQLTLVSTASAAWELGHDDGARLTSIRAPRGLTTLEYDVAGNLRRRVDRGVQTTFTMDPSSNRLAAVSGAFDATYRYDEAGHQIAGGGRTMRYDGRGRLEEIDTSGGARVRYVFDVYGHRVARIVR